MARSPKLHTTSTVEGTHSAAPETQVVLAGMGNTNRAFFAKSLPLFCSTKLNPAALPLLTLVAVALKVVSAISALPVAGGGGAAATVMLSACVSLKPLLSDTFKVNANVPAVDGVPLTRPLLLRLKPLGKLPLATDQVYGAVPAVTLACAEKATPTVPCCKPVVVMLGNEGGGGGGGGCTAAFKVGINACKDVLRVVLSPG